MLRKVLTQWENFINLYDVWSPVKYKHSLCTDYSNSVIIIILVSFFVHHGFSPQYNSNSNILCQLLHKKLFFNSNIRGEKLLLFTSMRLSCLFMPTSKRMHFLFKMHGTYYLIIGNNCQSTARILLSVLLKVDMPFYVWNREDGKRLSA